MSLIIIIDTKLVVLEKPKSYLSLNWSSPGKPDIISRPST